MMKANFEVGEAPERKESAIDPWGEVDAMLEQGTAHEYTVSDPRAAQLGPLAIMRVGSGLETIEEALASKEASDNSRPDLIGKDEDLETFELFEKMKKLGILPGSILYPACETRVAISEAFPEATVTYLDNHKGTVTALSEAGYDVVDGDMETFLPPDGKKYDMVYLQYIGQKSVPSEAALRSWLNENGLVVTDDFYNQTEVLKGYSGLSDAGSVSSDHSRAAQYMFRLNSAQ